MSTTIQSTILIIAGISGDLAKRKLLPALAQIAAAGALPKDFVIVGLLRRDVSLDDLLPAGEQPFLRNHLQLYHMDMADPADYVKLAHHLQTIESGFGSPAQRLFYLSVPPSVARPLVGFLGEAGLAGSPTTKLLLEKPFGTDTASAHDFIATTKKYFSEDQIYRIDHYLAKETAQNVVIFRGSNTLFRHSWNNTFIQAITITASESIAVEGRGVFYEQTGALRDFVQSHLLQLAALTLMELPNDWSTLPQARLAALQQLEPPHTIKRAQYTGYRDDVANPKSTVETFVSLTLQSNDPRWTGVPITLTTGKALAKKTTEIRITYKKEGANTQADQLVLRMQPNEGVELQLLAKQPGYDRTVQRHVLDFSYQNHYDNLPDAYERVFIDAMRSDRSLFTTSDEVIETWRILDPVQKRWEMHSDDLLHYAPGSSVETI